MPARILSIIVYLLLAELAFAQTPPANASAAPIQFPPGQTQMTIPLAKGWDALFVNVRINQKDAGYFLIDLHSPWSRIDTDHAGQLGLEVQGRSDNEAARGQKQPGIAIAKTLGFGPVGNANSPLSVGDGPGTFHGVPIGGVLGVDVLGQVPFTLDFRAGTLTLYDPAKFAPPRNITATELQAGADTPLVRATMQANGGQKNAGWFELDCADLNELSLGRAFMVLDQSSGGGGIAISGGGLLAVAAETNLYLSQNQTLQIPGCFALPAANRVYRLKAELGETSAGDIGLGILHNLRLTFDLSQQRVWAQPLEKESLDAMLQRLGDVKQADIVGARPLLQAALARRADAVAALLARHADANAADALGISPLMAAAGRGDAASVAALLAAGGQFDARSQSDAFTALLCAAQGGDVHSLELLLKAGSPIETTSQSGRTSLYLAAEARFAPVVQLLLDRHAEVDHALPNGQTPLMAACANGNADCVKLLLEHHANTNASGRLGTPLTLACEAGSAACVESLLRHQARVDQMDERGRIPLAAAAGCYSGAPCVKLLLDGGAQKAQTCRDEKTAYDWAVISGSPQTLRLLAN